MAKSYNELLNLVLESHNKIYKEDKDFIYDKKGNIVQTKFDYFNQNIDSGNKDRLRDSIGNLFYVNRSGSDTIEKLIKYAKSRNLDLWEPYKPDNFVDEKLKGKKPGQYTDDDFGAAVFALKDNFSKERYDTVIRIGKDLYGTRINESEKEKQQSNKSSNNTNKLLKNISSNNINTDASKNITKVVATAAVVSAAVASAIIIAKKLCNKDRKAKILLTKAELLKKEIKHINEDIKSKKISPEEGNKRIEKCKLRQQTILKELNKIQESIQNKNNLYI